MSAVTAACADDVGTELPSATQCSTGECVSLIGKLNTCVADIAALRAQHKQALEKQREADEVRNGQLNCMSERIFEAEKALHQAQKRQDDAIDTASIAFKRNAFEAQQDRDKFSAGIGCLVQKVDEISQRMASLTALQQDVAWLKCAAQDQQHRIAKALVAAEGSRDTIFQMTPQSEHRSLANRFGELQDTVMSLKLAVTAIQKQFDSVASAGAQSFDCQWAAESKQTLRRQQQQQQQQQQQSHQEQQQPHHQQQFYSSMGGLLLPGSCCPTPTSPRTTLVPGASTQVLSSLPSEREADMTAMLLCTDIGMLDQVDKRHAPASQLSTSSLGPMRDSSNESVVGPESIEVSASEVGKGLSSHLTVEDSFERCRHVKNVPDIKLAQGSVPLVGCQLSTCAQGQEETDVDINDVNTEEVERPFCLRDETQRSHMEASAADAGSCITLGSPGRGRSRFIPDTTSTGRRGAQLATTSGPGRRSWRGRGRGRSAEAPV